MSNAQKKAAKLSTLTNTIDQKHNEMLQHFHLSETETIPLLLNEKRMLKHKLHKLPEHKIDARLEIGDRIDFIRKQIVHLKRQKKNYFLDNSKYVFQYFEDKKKISGVDSETCSRPSSVSVNSFFRIQHATSVSGGGGEEVSPNESSDSDKYTNSRLLYQKYWRNINGGIQDAATTSISNYIMPSNKCEECGIGEMISQEEDGTLNCNNIRCGKFVVHIVDHSKPNNKEPPNEVTYTAYIRLNHFKEILSQFQAKETTQIKPEIYEMINNRIQKERITDMSTLTYDKMRDILRNLGLNKYFEHIQYINSLFGIKPPVMSKELYDTLCILFIEIQKPWAVHCPPDRSNFFNYTYTLYQLCVLLDQTQYLPYIPMMKDREKQLEQDMIWRKVCNDLDWEFFPTV